MTVFRPISSCRSALGGGLALARGLFRSGWLVWGWPLWGWLGRGWLGMGCLSMGTLAGVVGCEEEPVERPPIVGEEMGGTYNGLPPVSGGPGPEGGAPAGSGGTTSTGGQAIADGDLVGRVVVYLGDDFFFTEEFPALAEVAAESAQGMTWVSADYDGTSYALEGARLGPSTFLSAKPRAAVSDFMHTLSNEETQDGRADVALVSRAIVNEVFNSLVVPSAPLAGAAQLVVRVKDTGGATLSGVSVAARGAEFVTYANAGSWTEFNESTATTGLAFAGNLPASEFPGRLLDVTLAGEPVGSESLRVTVPVVVDAVTVVTVTVPEGAP